MPRRWPRSTGLSATMASRLITAPWCSSAVSWMPGCRRIARATAPCRAPSWPRPPTRTSLPIVGKREPERHAQRHHRRATCARCSAEAISPTRVVAIMFDANIPTQNTRRNTTIIAATTVTRSKRGDGHAGPEDGRVGRQPAQRRRRAAAPDHRRGAHSATATRSTASSANAMRPSMSRTASDAGRAGGAPAAARSLPRRPGCRGRRGAAAPSATSGDARSPVYP